MISKKSVMRASGKMENEKDLENIYGLIGATMKESGMRTKHMGREN